MATALKVLGQQKPAATTPADLYTVPALKSAVVSSLSVCNQAGTATTFRISVSVGGGATAAKDYLFYDHPLAPNETFIATIGASVAAGDIIRVYDGSGNVSFSAFGQEIS